MYSCFMGAYQDYHIQVADALVKIQEYNPKNRKIYNVGGMAQYAGAEYRDIVTDTAEITVTATYSFEGLTRIAP